MIIMENKTHTNLIVNFQGNKGLTRVLKRDINNWTFYGILTLKH